MLRTFYKTTDNKLVEFFGKHKDDIESIISGIIDEVGNSFKTIIIFDGTSGDNYSTKLTFKIEHMNVVSEKSEDVSVTSTELNLLVRTYNLIK